MSESTAITNAVTLAELMIVAASEAWRDNGELLASGITTIPRLGASLAKLTHSPELLMTDSEAYLVSEPVPLGPRGDYRPKIEGYLPFRAGVRMRLGRSPPRDDRPDADRPLGPDQSVGGRRLREAEVAVLGVRGLPGNSLCHANSFFVPNHGPRVFVSGEVDMVSGVGYNPARWQPGMRRDDIDLRLIVTDLCVMDFEGPAHAVRVRSLHPGVSFDQVQAATGFPLMAAPNLGTTPLPTTDQLAIIRRLDPHNLRGSVLRDNPPAVRQPAERAA